jgi:hypothetical protein
MAMAIAIAPRRNGAHTLDPRRISKFLSWWVRGLARPTPFFDDRTKAPRAVPRVLTRSERGAL